MTDQSTPATGDGVDAQLHGVRQRLVRDGAASGVDESIVVKAIEDAANDYRSAPVQTFVGVLVERAVREQLSIRSLPTDTSS